MGGGGGGGVATRVPGEIELRSIPVGFCLNYWGFFSFFPHYSWHFVFYSAESVDRIWICLGSDDRLVLPKELLQIQ